MHPISLFIPKNILPDVQFPDDLSCVKCILSPNSLYISTFFKKFPPTVHRPSRTQSATVVSPFSLFIYGPACGHIYRNIFESWVLYSPLHPQAYNQMMLCSTLHRINKCTEIK